MKIGFDLDGIFIDKPPFIPKQLIERLYKDRSNGILHYRIPSKTEQYIRSLSHFSFLRPAIANNITALIQLAKEKQHTLFLISSRFGFLQKRTQAIVKKYNFEKIFKKLYFNIDNYQPHLFKNDMIKDLKLDRYIDDDLSLLKFLSKENHKVNFFWFNNKKNQKLSDNLFAITHLTALTD